MKRDKIIFICIIAVIAITGYVSNVMIFENCNPAKWIGNSGLLLGAFELFLLIISSLVLKNKL